jgi:putative tricarboxylic transport membrane protein
MLELVATVLMPALVGAVVGTVVGVLPGIGPAATIALMLPSTFGASPQTALVMLSAVYFGAQYGSSTTAILLNLPGEASGVVTAQQGHRMALDGRAGVALVAAALASLLAGLLTAALIAVSTPQLASLALALGPVDIVLLVTAATVAVMFAGEGGPRRNAAMLALGALFGLVGADFGGGAPRFTFGVAALRDGIGLVPLMVGLFGLGEVLARWSVHGARGRIAPTGRVRPTSAEWRAGVPAALRGTVVGALVGMLPGGSTLLAALGSAAIERRVAADRAGYGRGTVSGVAGPEAANNAAAQTGWVPLLALGLPGNPVMAVMLGAFLLHGVPPGAVLFERRPEVFEALVVGMVVGNLVLVVLNLPLVGLWIRLLRVPVGVLMPLVVLLAVLGVYAHSRFLFDVWLLLGFGLLGWLLRRAGFGLAPIVFGAVLAPLLEDHLRRAWLLSRGDPLVWLQAPTALPLALCATLLLAARIWRRSGAG